MISSQAVLFKLLLCICQKVFKYARLEKNNLQNIKNKKKQLDKGLANTVQLRFYSQQICLLYYTDNILHSVSASEFLHVNKTSN